MTSKQYRETFYHLWNPGTNMNILDYFGIEPTVITHSKGASVFNDRGVS